MPAHGTSGLIYCRLFLFFLLSLPPDLKEYVALYERKLVADADPYGRMEAQAAARLAGANTRHTSHATPFTLFQNILCCVLSTLIRIKTEPSRSGMTIT